MALPALIPTILGFVGKQVDNWFEDRRNYRQQKNEMMAHGLGTFGGGFIVATWLSPFWVAIFEGLFPQWFGGSTQTLFAVFATWPQWYTGTVITISLGAFGADTVAKLPKSWGKS